MTQHSATPIPQHPRIMVVVFPDGRGSLRLDDELHEIRGVTQRDAQHQAIQLVTTLAARPLARTVRVDAHSDQGRHQLLVSPDGTVAEAQTGWKPTTITPALSPALVVPAGRSTAEAVAFAMPRQATRPITAGQLAAAGGATLLAAAVVATAAAGQAPRRQGEIDLTSSAVGSQSTITPSTAATATGTPAATATAAPAATATAAPTAAAAATAAPAPTAPVASSTTGASVNLAEVNRALTALSQAIANAQAVLSSAAPTPVEGSASTAAPTPSQEPAAPADAMGSPEEEAELNEAAKAATLAIIESNTAGAQPAPAPSASTATTAPTAAPTASQGAQPAAPTATSQATAAAPQPAATSASAGPTSPAPTATSRPTPTAAASPTGAGTATITPSSPATPAATSGTGTSAAGTLEVQPAPVPVPDDEISQQDSRTTTSASPSAQAPGQRTGTAEAQPQDASTPATTPTAGAAARTDGGWLSGAAGDGVTDGALGDWRGKPLAISGTWQDTGDAQTQMWNLAPGEEFGDWDKPLDLAPGGFNDGDSWSAAASGAYDDRWREGLTKAAQFRAGKGTTYIRPFHELNGNWYPWSVAPGQEQDFITAWKRYRVIQQQVFPDAKLVFNVNVNSVGGLDWRKAWPGKEYADVLGVDMYNGSPKRYNTPEAWTSELDATGDDGIPIGLNAYTAQAKAWGVPLAVPEWSGRAEEGDDPAFITGIGEWFAAHAGTGPGQLLYEVMFNVDRNNDNFRLFQGTRMPQSAQAYREAFSKPASSGTGATTLAAASPVAANTGQAGADQRSQDSDQAAQASTKTGAGAPDSADQRATAAGDASESGDVGDAGNSGGFGDVNATAGFENRHDGSGDRT